MNVGALDFSKTLVIIPAYNEGIALPAVLGTIREHWSGLDVMVIDDGSQDDTARVAKQGGAAVISHVHQMGYGTAIQTGYKFAYRHGYHYLVQLDGDGQHEVQDIGKLLGAVQSGSCSLALGSRFAENCNYRSSVYRRIGTVTFRFLLWLMSGLNISDPTTGFQAMNREVMTIFIHDYFPSDYPDSDIIILLSRFNIPMQEIPVRMYSNGEGKSMHSNPVRSLYYVFKMVVSMILTKYRKL